MFGAIIGAVGSAILGSIGAKKQAKAQKKAQLAAEQRNLQQMEDIEKSKYGWIRDGALAAGFNPLTALRAGGGRLTQNNAIQATPVSGGASWFAAADAVNNIGKAWDQREDAIDKATREANLELRQLQIEGLRSEMGRQGNAPATATANSPKQKKWEISTLGQLYAEGPLLPPSDPRSPRAEAYLPDGTRVYPLVSQMEQFGWPRGYTLTGGDVSELIGEFAGEVSNVYSTDQIIDLLLDQNILTDRNPQGGPFSTQVKTGPAANKPHPRQTIGMN